MKKRLLSALLALALVFVLLPTTALAGVAKGSDYDISINGTNYVFSDSETCYFKSSFTSTEPSSPYLKLTKSSDTITVTVSGYVTVSDINVHNNFSTQDKINLIITGNKGSTLNIECKDTYGAALETYQSGDITIKGGITVNANFSADNTDKYTDCYGIRASKNLIITGKGTTVNAVNADDAAAVKVDGNITVSDGAQLKATNKYSKKVTNYTGKAYAIECGGLSISGNNTKVTAKTSKGEKAISGTVYNLTENDDYKLTFKAGMYEGAPSFDYPKPMDKALGYEYVEITQAPTDPYVFIAGEPAIMDQETPIPGGTGTYLYKKTTYNGSFLTLKGVDITGTSSGPARFIQFGKNGGYYTIQLEGENKISGFSSGIVAPEDPGVNDVTVVLSGSGSLDITANQYAIDMQVGKLKFENTGTIKLTTGYNYYFNPLNALRVKTGNISIDNTKYDIVGARQEKNYPTETISDSSAFTPDLLNGYTVGEETTLFKTITITPAAAKDSTIRYNGTTLKQGETIRNGGTATVDSKNNTITLKNFNGTAALSFDATLADSTLVLEGTNTLSSIVTTQKGLTISGSGSLTVGSIKVHNQKTSSDDKPNLTINGGAQVTVNRPSSEDLRAIDIDGDLTVTNGSLTATSTSNNVPTVQVGGNASFTGSTVTITNNSATQGKSGKNSYEVSTGLYVGGTLDIKNAAKVTSTVIGGNAIYANDNITISGDNTEVNAQNSAYKFSAISTKTVNISDNSTVKAENLKKHQGDPTGETDPSTGKTYNACPAITGKIANKNTQNKLHIVGFTTSSAGSQNPTEGTPLNFDIDPSSAERYILHYDVTITRGDAYTTPQVAANYTIAGQAMYVGKYYKTDANGNITDGTAQDYNIYCDNENDFTLNNATISSTTDVAINTNIRYETNIQHHIKLIGTNRINNTFKHAISGGSRSSTIIIESARNASDASLTINGNYLPIYSDGKVIINAEVVIVNTTDDNSFKGLISTSDGKGAFDLGSGYKCYASTSTTGTPLEEFNSANYSTYKYLRVTTQTLETGGGSTHQHTWDTTKWYSVGDDYHARKCTGCDEYDLTNKQAHYAWPDEDKGPEGHTEKCMLCDYKYDQSVIKPHEWVGWWVNDNDYRREIHAQMCNCGYLGSVHYTLVYVAIDGNYHQKQCPVDGCDYKLEYTTTSHVYEEGSNICTECGYDKSAPCNHTGDRVYTNNGDGTHKVTCKACGATIVEKETHEFDPTGACVCGATQSGGNPTPDIPAAPTGLAGVAPTSANSKDGKITGTTAAMEYATEPNGSNWIECGGDEVTGLSAGTYYVRYKQTTDKPASAVATVVVPAYSGGGEIVPPTPDNPGTIVIIRPAEEEKPAQQPNPSTGANDLVGLAVAAAVAAALGSAALLRKHD